MKILALIFILLIFVSCGRDTSSSNDRRTRIEEEQITGIMDRQNFDCASLGGPCPSGVSRLLIINRTDPSNSAVCSGFMIGPRTLVTNHHCVNSSSQCSNTYIAVYTGGSYEQTRCQRIIKTVEDSSDPNDPRRSRDFTIMETQGNYQGDYFSLSTERSSPGDNLHAWVIDHTGLDEERPNLYNSRVTELDCEVMDQNERSSLVAMKCPSISGNSGSPVLNDKGEVMGVIWGGTSFGIDTNYPLSLRRNLEFMALLTESIYIK